MSKMSPEETRGKRADVKERLCSTCKESIGEARLLALPRTTVCVKCSTEKPLKGVMVYDHKTAPTLQVGTEEEVAEFKRLDRKGPYASLPMDREAKRTGPMISSSFASRKVEGTVVNRSPARCHPDRPAVAYGKCFECSVAWYRNRAKK